MRNSGLFPKLAMQSIRNNRKFYLPYILALVGDVAAIYIMQALVKDPGAVNMTPGRPNGYLYVNMFMTVGMFIAFFFSAIFVLYINGFLIKQRKKELGLYNILGMGKGHIAVVLVIETVYIGIAGIAGGIAVGLLLHKLVSLFLHRTMNLPVPFGFYICWDGMAQTALLFAGLLAVTLVFNLNKVRVSKPIELLRGGNVGEREPKTRWLLTLLGIATLGWGYYIAVTTRTGMDAIVTYFGAVGLVIVGTYCLFTAVSIFILKALRKNKKFYYKTGHFIGISGMLYRMKQNAVGLANICILCTMVMVMLSGTLSLYLGTADMIQERYPGDLNIEVGYFPQPWGDNADNEDWAPFDPDAMLAANVKFIEEQGVNVEKIQTSYDLSFGAGLISDGVYTTDRFNDDAKEVVLITCITESNYTAATGETLGLAPDEAAAYNVKGDEVTIRWTVDKAGTELGESTFRIVKTLRENPQFNPDIMRLVTIVVADDAVINELWARQAEAYPDNWSEMQWFAYLDVDCGEDEIEKLERIQDGFYELALTDSYEGTGSWLYCHWEPRSAGEEDAYGLAGGFLFLGIFLGFIFLLATVLIIYYKQISEGYEDKERFEIMQKVGLSRSEVKKSIHSQILMVFFLPILVAAIHIIFDFNMVEKLLTMFYIHNTALTAMCTVGTVLVFFAAYGIVYLLTARTYYKIVER